MSTARGRLHDGRGELVATFARGSDDGLPLVRDIRAEEPVRADRVADAILAALAGHVVAADPLIAESLIARGASVRRRSAVMCCRLPASDDPPVPAGVTIAGAAGLDAGDLLDAYVDAYPPDHPDHRALEPDRQRETLQELIDGAVIGPLMRCSRVAMVGARATGAALLFDAREDESLRMPWVGELFRHPSAPRGTGAALLGSALAAAAAEGLQRVGLRVTEGNPARVLYERLGFAETRRIVSVLIAPA